MITSHNTFLTVITEFGVIGFLLYLFPVAYWMILAWKVRNRLPESGPKGKPVVAMFFLSMVMQLAVNNFLDMRFFPYAIAIMWMCVAFIANGVTDITSQPVPYGQQPGTDI
jgi:O-antigen ligase